MKKHLKLVLFLGMALVFIASLVACAAPEPAPAPAPATTPASTLVPEDTMQPQKWDCMMYMAGLTTYNDIQLQGAFDRIKERTDGLLDIRLTPHGALPIKESEWGRAVAKGELEMCQFSGEYNAGDYPILGVLDVPFLYTNKLEKRLVWETARPILQAYFEEEGIHCLSYIPQSGQSFCANQPVDLMNLNGLKVRSYSVMTAKMIEAMGGVPVPIAWPEAYTALERGVADALLTGTEAIYNAKIHEVVPYSYDVGLLNGVYTLAVNKELWDMLPKDVLIIVYEELAQFEGLSALYQERNMAKVFDLMLDDVAPDGGHEVAPPEYIELVRREVSIPLMREEVEKAGPLGETLVSTLEKALGRELQ